MKNTDTLKKNYEFKNVFTKGRGYYGKFINIYITKNNGNNNKIGIAVGKKIATAVKRNKIKRWIREAYRVYEDKLNSNYRMVFTLNKNVKVDEVNFTKIREDIKTILKKAGAIT